MSWAVKINLSAWRCVDSAADIEVDEYYLATEDGPPPELVLLPARVEADAIALLDAKQRQAAVQISAIQSRIDSLNYLIDVQDPEDPEYMEPTTEEIADLPVRKAQIKLWNTYRAKLGRVKTSPGWYQTPAWPVMPEPYTSEMSASSRQLA